MIAVAFKANTLIICQITLYFLIYLICEWMKSSFAELEHPRI